MSNLASCTYTSLLQASRATMYLDGIREVELRLTGFQIPQINLGVASQPTALLDIPHPASQMTYQALSVSFSVDENLTNYLALHNWLVNIGSPESRAQYESLGEKVHRDLNVFFYNSLHNKIATVKFIDAFPTTVGSIEMHFNETIPEPVRIGATFAYQRFVIEENE